jgi:hypothetical protein
MPTGSCVFPSSSKAEIAYKLKLNTKLNFVSRPVFHVLSNDSIVFGVSLLLCTGKLMKLFTRTVLAFNLHTF